MTASNNNNTKRRIANLCETIWPKLNRIALSWGCSSEQANDLAQETCMIALDKFQQLRKPEAMESWMISIMNNCHKRYLRDRREVTSLDDNPLPGPDDPENNIDQQSILTRVRRAISQLNDDQRKILTLVDMEGMSYIETANALDLKVGTVMSRLARGRNRLRTLLKPTLSSNSNPDINTGVVRKIK